MLGVQIYFGGGTPSPAAVEYDRFMLIVDGSEASLSESAVYEIASQEELTDYGFPTTSRAYKSAAIFFGASPTPSRLFVYAYVSGDTVAYANSPLQKVTDTIWETVVKPPTFSGNELVHFYGCGDETGYIDNYADGSVGLPFTVYEDEEGNWTGQLRFLSGLSGSEGIVEEDNLTSTCDIRADFTVGTESGIGEAIEDYNINGVAIAIDPTTSTNYSAGNLPFGTDQVDMMMKMRNILMGKECLWFFSIPGGATPDTTVTGATNPTLIWSDIKNSLIGAQEYVHTHKITPAEEDDMAAGVMGMTAATHPHRTMSAAQPHMGIAQQEPKAYRTKFEKGQITTIMKRPELSGEPYLLTEGFTFGSGDFSRINGTRCKYIIAQNLRNVMWALIAERETYCSVAGCNAIENRIRGLFKYLQNLRIVDGLADVRIPMREEFKNNTEAAQLAAQRNEIPGVEIDYIFYRSLEHISITQVDNVTT